MVVVLRRLLAFLVGGCALLNLAAAGVAQAPLSVPPPVTSSASPYRINAGDELEVLVWGDERLQRSVLVLPDGTFAFPLVGQVNAAGRLPSEIERIITAGLQPQYKGPVPQVTVSVKKPSGYQFSVIGKVRSPGHIHARPICQRTRSSRDCGRPVGVCEYKLHSSDPKGGRPPLCYLGPNSGCTTG